MHEFPVGHVWVRNWWEGPKWIKVVIVDRFGPLSYLGKKRVVEATH